MSIAVLPLIRLIINYTPWGIRLDSVLYTVTSFMFITSVIAWLRRRQLPGHERFRLEFQLRAGGGVTRVGIGHCRLSPGHYYGSSRHTGLCYSQSSGGREVYRVLHPGVKWQG